MKINVGGEHLILDKDGPKVKEDNEGSQVPSVRSWWWPTVGGPYRMCIRGLAGEAWLPFEGELMLMKWLKMFLMAAWCPRWGVW